MVSTDIEDVVKILGDGEEINRSEVAGYITIMARWANPDGSKIIITFQDGKVLRKTQFGLKDDNTTATKSEEPKVSEKEWRKIKEWQGNGIKTTEKFTVGSEWAISWTTKAGILQIYVYASDGELFNLAANTMIAGSDISYFHKAGTYYLEINALQPYTVQVSEPR